MKYSRQISVYIDDEAAVHLQRLQKYHPDKSVSKIIRLGLKRLLENEDKTNETK